MEKAGKLTALKNFIEECWDELTKVTWPDFEQLKSATLVVILFVIIISGVIWLMDVLSRTVIGFIMGLFGAS
ncbi:MAG: preprotein translocase subunit SecE [Longimicrobiales bacterium]|jgi:preprotein translocase SecE subunit|nr:preprotein translocase subunit SecE [Longimicrobiales bacterium]|tara:strand:- start:95 stop:310 length:216 start_codon:yes stop_codon:yes gene_type:complete